MKRIFCFLISTILLISIFTIPSFADDVAFNGSSATVKPGDEVTVSFAISANSKLGAAGFKVKYDSDVFSYVDYEDGPAFKGQMSVGNCPRPGEFLFAFISVNGIDNGGVMFSITFEVNNTAVKGRKYPFEFIIDNLNKADTSELKGKNTTAYVTIGDKTTDPVIQTPATPNKSSSTTDKPNSSNSVQSTPNKTPSNSNNSKPDESNSKVESSNVESFDNELPTISLPVDSDTSNIETNTDTDIDNVKLNTLSIIVIILSVLAVLSIVIMIILLNKSRTINKKEK